MCIQDVSILVGLSSYIYLSALAIPKTAIPIWALIVFITVSHSMTNEESNMEVLKR